MTLTNVEHLLFESPWPLVAVFVVVAMALTFIARQQVKPKLKYPAYGFAVAAGALVATALLVRTPAESLRIDTRGFVESTSPWDENVFREIVSSQLILTSSGGATIMQGPALVDSIVSVFDRYPVAHHRIHDIQIESLTDDFGVVILDLRTTFDTDSGMGFPGPHATKWRLGWEKANRPDGDPNHPTLLWHLVEMQWLEYNQQAPPDRYLNF